MISPNISKVTPGPPRNKPPVGGPVAPPSTEAEAAASAPPLPAIPSVSRGRPASYLDPMPGEDDALLALDPESAGEATVGGTTGGGRATAAAPVGRSGSNLIDYEGVLSPEEAQELSVALVAKQVCC